MGSFVTSLSINDVIHRLRELGGEPRRKGRGYEMRCLWHADTKSSLKITEGRNGTLVTCFAGCDPGVIGRSIGGINRPRRDGAVKESKKTETKEKYISFRTLQAGIDHYTRTPGSMSWVYHDANGVPVGAVVRVPVEGGKRIIPLAVNSDGTCSVKGMPTPRPLYNLPDVIAADTVWVVEGEKCAEAIKNTLGFVATTSPHGAASARYADWGPLSGKKIVIIPDEDDAGVKYAREVASLAKRAGAADIRTIRMRDVTGRDDLNSGYDIADYLEETPKHSALAAILKTIESTRPEEKRVSETTLKKNIPPFSEIWFAHKFAQQYQRTIRYAADMGHWYVWDGQRWVVDIAKSFSTRIENLLAMHLSMAPKDALKLISRMFTTSKVDSIINYASRLPDLHITAEQLDANDMILNTLNGVLDLETLELHPHSPKYFCTQICGAEYHPDATCRRWERFISTITEGNQDLIDALQAAAGYTLTGDTGERLMFFLHGLGANGKSTFLETLSAVMGSYSCVINAESLLERISGGEQTNDIAMLRGKRFVYSNEAPENRKLNESRIKALTGGDRIRARFLYREFFSYTPQFKLWFAANHRPIIRGSDEGVWSRIFMIPLIYQFPVDERQSLKQVVDGFDKSGVLAWCVRGLQKRNRLRNNETVKECVEEYRDDMDPLLGFVRDCIEITPGARCSANRIYDEYTRWCEEVGIEHPLSKIGLLRKLSERKIGKRIRAKTWRGLEGVYVR